MHPAQSNAEAGIHDVYRYADGSVQATLDALVGSDVARERGQVVVFVDRDGIRTPCGSRLSVSDGETLVGWGFLNGPSYLVGRMNIPRRTINRLRDIYWRGAV